MCRRAYESNDTLAATAPGSCARPPPLAASPMACPTASGSGRSGLARPMPAAASSPVATSDALRTAAAGTATTRNTSARPCSSLSLPPASRDLIQTREIAPEAANRSPSPCACDPPSPSAADAAPDAPLAYPSKPAKRPTEPAVPDAYVVPSVRPRTASPAAAAGPAATSIGAGLPGKGQRAHSESAGTAIRA